MLEEVLIVPVVLETDPTCVPLSYVVRVYVAEKLATSDIPLNKDDRCAEVSVMVTSFVPTLCAPTETVTRVVDPLFISRV